MFLAPLFSTRGLCLLQSRIVVVKSKIIIMEPANSDGTNTNQNQVAPSSSINVEATSGELPVERVGRTSRNTLSENQNCFFPFSFLAFFAIFFSILSLYLVYSLEVVGLVVSVFSFELFVLWLYSVGRERGDPLEMSILQHFTGEIQRDGETEAQERQAALANHYLNPRQDPNQDGFATSVARGALSHRPALLDPAALAQLLLGKTCSGPLTLQSLPADQECVICWEGAADDPESQYPWRELRLCGHR